MQSRQPSLLHAIDTTGPGGAETVFLDLAQFTCIAGLRNIAIIKGPGWVEEQLKSRGIEYYLIKPQGFLSIPYYWQVAKLIKSQQVKLIQANLLGSTLTFAILSLITRVPVIATLHGQVDVNNKERFIRLKNWLIRLGVKQLVTVSNDLKRYIARRGLFNEDAITTIYNGINLDRYQNAKSLQLKDRLSIPVNSVLIGCIGNIRPAKDYFNLVRAAAIVVKACPHAHFVIAGHPKADLMSGLNNLVEEIQLHAHVHFLGFIDDTPGFLAELDVFALSSISEGFSIATLEAMAASVPIVATRCGGPEEIISDQLDGILVPTQNSTELAQAIITLLNNHQLRNNLSNRARQTVREKFSIGAMLDQYKMLYQKALTSTVNL